MLFFNRGAEGGSGGEARVGLNKITVEFRAPSVFRALFHRRTLMGAFFDD